jgi:hypothetical protein
MGTQDIIAVINCQFVRVEVKVPRGDQTEHQRHLQRKLEQAGGKYLLIFSLDDGIAGL